MYQILLCWALFNQSVLPIQPYCILLPPEEVSMWNSIKSRRGLSQSDMQFTHLPFLDFFISRFLYQVPVVCVCVCIRQGFFFFWSSSSMDCTSLFCSLHRFLWRVQSHYPLNGRSRVYQRQETNIRYRGMGAFVVLRTDNPLPFLFPSLSMSCFFLLLLLLHSFSHYLIQGQCSDVLIAPLCSLSLISAGLKCDTTALTQHIASY